MEAGEVGKREGFGGKRQNAGRWRWGMQARGNVERGD